MRRTLDRSLQIMSSISKISSLLFVSSWASLWVHVHCSYSKRKPCKWNADDHIRAVYKVIFDYLVLFICFIFLSLIFKLKFSSHEGRSCLCGRVFRQFGIGHFTFGIGHFTDAPKHSWLSAQRLCELSELKITKVNFIAQRRPDRLQSCGPHCRCWGPVKCMSSITFSYCNMQVVLFSHELFIM